MLVASCHLKRRSDDGISHAKGFPTRQANPLFPVYPSGGSIFQWRCPKGCDCRHDGTLQSDPLRRSWLGCAATASGIRISAQSIGKRSAANNLRPSGVMLYVTFTGMMGSTLRLTSPSRSSERSVWLSIVCKTPPIRRFNPLRRKFSLPSSKQDQGVAKPPLSSSFGSHLKRMMNNLNMSFPLIIED